MGYHGRSIEKGTYGEFSKIREEFQELEDAQMRSQTILVLCELADLVGAIDGYLRVWHPSVTIHDVLRMAMLTKSAFEDGERQ